MPQDLAGIVAKRKDLVYASEPATWLKIKNPNYSQAVGRHGQFEKVRPRAPSRSSTW